MGVVSAKLLEFPSSNVGDIPRMLRSLADDIESGKIEGAQNIAWALGKEGGAVEVGLMGASPEAGATAYLLLGLAKARIEKGCLDYVDQ